MNNVYQPFLANTTLGFLYSDSDKCIPSSDIEEIAEERIKQGMEVSKVNFETSGHVGHLDKFPARYAESIKDIVEKVR